MDRISSIILASQLSNINDVDMIRTINTMIGSESNYIRELASIINDNMMQESDSQYNRVLANSLSDETPIRMVLSDEGESVLNKRKFTENDNCVTCPIYHIPFEIDDYVTELPCGHIFSCDGINKWLKEQKAECPVCRLKLASKEIKCNNTGLQQLSEDITELSASRTALASNLRRLTFPIISEHPFGGSIHRTANIVHEDDQIDDIIRAMIMTYNVSSTLNNNHPGS